MAVFPFCSRLAREIFFAQALPHALIAWIACAASPLAKGGARPGSHH